MSVTQTNGVRSVEYDARHEAAMIMAVLDELTTRVKRLVNAANAKEKKIVILDDSSVPYTSKATVEVQAHSVLDDDFPETYKNRGTVAFTKAEQSPDA